MLTRKFNRKSRQMDFFIDGTFVRSADLDEVSAVEAELQRNVLKALSLHG
ncbi:MAG: hypothetical protein HC828_03620 [Blastochloris sp.]|nr:hypothetical protein [Blastochloris sp.]